MKTSITTLVLLLLAGFSTPSDAGAQTTSEALGESGQSASGQSASGQSASGQSASGQNASGMSAHEHNAQFKHDNLDIEMWLGRLEDPDRDVIKNLNSIIDTMALQPGQRVADIGAGTGPFLAPISSVLGPEGHLFAVDTAPTFVSFMRERAQRDQLDNVTVVLSRNDDITLPPESADVIYIIDTYHHLDPVSPMLASVMKALKPGGEFIVIDWNLTDDAREWVRRNIRADKTVFRAEIEASGFEFVSEDYPEGLSENFFFKFRKPVS